VRLHIVSPALPPQLDGIGDYTARIAAELAGTVDVTVVTSWEADADPIPGVSIERCFSPSQPSTVHALFAHVREERPDWLLVEYNPFAYGRWGLNLHLPAVIGSIRRRLPPTRVAIMCHEVFTPASDLRFTVMTTWQRAQLLALGRKADCLFFSLEAWTRRFTRWFPGTPVVHLPVGSNVPRVAIGRHEARERLGIGPEKLVLGLFGTVHPSRMLDLTRRSVEAALDAGHDAVLLYVGPHASVVEKEFARVPLIATAGAVAPEEVSRRLTAMDIHLVAFLDGVSTRRGTLMAGLQHGVPTVGTSGVSTDSVLRAADGRAFLLSPAESPQAFCECVLRLSTDGDLRLMLGAGAGALYEREFDWTTLAKRLLDALTERGQSAGGRGL